MIYIGIDPGAKGAMAVLFEPTSRMIEAGRKNIEITDDRISLIPFDEALYLRVLRGIKASGKECVCCIEDVHSLPREGVTSAHNFGRTVGWLYGVLDAIGIPYQPITPQKWKKEFGLTSDKAKSVEVCRRLYPDVNLKRTERSKKDDDNCAEACLLALYAKRKF